MTLSRALSPLASYLLIAAIAVPAFAADPVPTPPLDAAGAAPANAERESEGALLKAKGDALFRARNYVEAVAMYEQAYAASADPRVLYNHARALQALGRYGDALGVLTRFTNAAPPDLAAQLSGLDALFADLRARVCEVVVHVNEPGARVTFKDRVLGLTPLGGPLLLEAGQGSLRVVKDGYFAFAREVTLRGGGSASFDVTLGSTERHARLIARSHVQGALISVDDRKLAQAPIEAMLLPGAHRILAHRDGFADASTQVIVDAGQSRIIDLDPIERHPLLEQWWFWTGVGVVAAAGSTAAVLIARDHRAASDGNFSPSAISAPLGRF